MARSNYRLPKIPEMTIRRLSVYTRCLLQLEEDGVKTVSSQELAERFNLNSAQVRKDLAYFGEFGVRGIGYYVSGLKAELQRILGLDREWAVALVGFGNLGSALFHYKGFSRQGFRIAVVIDDDPAKVGREVDAVPIVSSRDMAREIKARGIQIAIVAVPVEAAQAVTDQLVAAGIKAVLNFAPDPPARGPRRASQERRSVDRAGDALLLSGQGRAVSTSPSLRLSDRTVSYEDYGSGPIALLIHGSPGNGKAWARVGERLSDRYRVIAPDLPGYGDTTALPLHAEPDTADTAGAARSHDGHHRHRRRSLAGHSYGGVVALTLALRGRLTMGALALFEPVAVPILLMTGERELFQRDEGHLRRLHRARGGGRGRRDASIMVDFWFGPGAFARMPEPLTAFMTRARVTNTRDIRGAFRPRYTPEALGRLTMPLVTVVGGRSPDVTGKIARAIVGHAPRASLVTLDTATHALTTTHAEAVAQAIDEAAGRGPAAATGSHPVIP